MAEPMTMELARQLRAQDCQLPSLAGPAIKLLFDRIEFLEGAMRAAAATLEGDADEHGAAAALRIALCEQPRLIGVDEGSDDGMAVCVARAEAGGHVHVEQIVHWPRRSGRTTAQLLALKAALQLYPSRNTHQLQAAKVCQGVSRLAQQLLAAGLSKPLSEKTHG